MAYSEEQIKDLLKDVVDPNTNDSFINDKSIKSISIKDNDLDIKVVLGYPAKSQLNEVKDLIATQIQKTLPKINLNIELSITTENLSIENINFYKLKSYYFCSRYFITDLLFSENLLEKAYVTDADIIFNEKISFDKK